MVRWGGRLSSLPPQTAVAQPQLWGDTQKVEAVRAPRKALGSKTDLDPSSAPCWGIPRQAPELF